MAIDATDAAKLRIGALGVAVDTTLDPATLNTTWTTTGPAANRNALAVLNSGERMITRAINALDTDLQSAKITTDAFATRFNAVIGNETGADQAAFQSIGTNLIQAIAAGTGGPGGIGDVTQAQLTQAITTHDESPTAHTDIRQLIANLTISGGAGAAVWGNITGTLNSQADLKLALDHKQDALVSGTSIKTINNLSLLGAGNLIIEGGGGASTAEIEHAIDVHDDDPAAHALLRQAIDSINAGAGGLPSGGIKGQSLFKESDVSFDTEWGWGDTPPATETYTTPGTFQYQVVRSGLYVLMAAGAGGGGSSFGHHASGGGGSVVWLTHSFEAGDTLNVTVGQGGAHAGAAGGTGTAGGDSSVGKSGNDYITAGGGKGAFTGLGGGNLYPGAGGQFFGDGATGVNGNPGIEGVGAAWADGGAPVSISHPSFFRQETVTSGAGVGSNPASPPGGNGEVLIAFITGMLLPKGGLEDQVLRKKSNDDYDVEWGSVVPTDPETAQVVHDPLADIPFSNVAGSGTTWTVNPTFATNPTGAVLGIFTRVSGTASQVAFYQAPDLSYFLPGRRVRLQFQAAVTGGNFTVLLRQSGSTTTTNQQNLATITPATLDPITVDYIVPNVSNLFQFISVLPSATAAIGTFRMLVVPQSERTRVEGDNQPIFTSGQWDARIADTNLWIGGGGVNSAGAQDNISLGLGALQTPRCLGTLAENIAIGKNALRSLAPNPAMSSVGNIAIGTDTLAAANNPTVAGFGYNIAIGTRSLMTSTTGVNNVAIGFEALRQSTTGSNAVAIGYQALRHRTTGTYNIGIGYLAGAQNTTGAGVVAIGYRALSTADPSTTAYAATGTTAVGYMPLAFLTSGTYNTAFGYQPLYNLITGNQNNGFGLQTLYYLTTGNSNTGIGNYALHNITTGSFNTAIGAYAGQMCGDRQITTEGTANRGTNNTLSSESTFVGYYAASMAQTPTNIANGTPVNYTNQTVIGYDAIGGGNNTITLGNTLITALRCQRTTITALSDMRVKEDIQPANLDLCIAAVKQLPVSRWTWSEKAGTHEDKHVTGWLADDYEKVWPKGVTRFIYKDIEDAKYITPEEALPTLWGAVQKLIERNEELEAKIAELGKEKT